MIRTPKLKLKKIVQSRREASPNFSPSPMGTSLTVAGLRDRPVSGGQNDDAGARRRDRCHRSVLAATAPGDACSLAWHC